jgi:hypothetical protein
MLRCPVPDADERMHEVAFLAALQYKASGDDQRRATNHAYVPPLPPFPPHAWSALTKR